MSSVFPVVVAEELSNHLEKEQAVERDMHLNSEACFFFAFDDFLATFLGGKGMHLTKVFFSWKSINSITSLNLC